MNQLELSVKESIFGLLALNIQHHRGRFDCLLSLDGTVVPATILPPGLKDWIPYALSVSDPHYVYRCRTTGRTGQPDIITLCHSTGLHDASQL